MHRSNLSQAHHRSTQRRIAYAVGALLLPMSVLAGNPLIFADSFEPGPPALTFQTPDIPVLAGESATYCYYLRTDNTVPVGVYRFVSSFGTGIAHIIVYGTYSLAGEPVERQPPGTLTTLPCGLIGDGSSAFGWLYAAHAPAAQLMFPADDGTGQPLAAELLPDQPLVLQVRIVNASDQPLTTSAQVRAEIFDPGTMYTRTATFNAINTALSVPPGGFASAIEDCPVPAEADFWWMSTRTHRFGMQAELADDASVLLVSDDWTHPDIASFDPPAFFEFASGQMRFTCDYFNPTGFSITSGDNEDSDEACIGIGYFFPADRPRMCVDGTTLP